MAEMGNMLGLPVGALLKRFPQRTTFVSPALVHIGRDAITGASNPKPRPLQQHTRTSLAILELAGSNQNMPIFLKSNLEPNP